MKTPRMQIARVIAAETLDGSFGSGQVTSLAAYLLDEGRSSEVESLVRDVQNIRTSHGIIDAVVYSAHPLSVSAMQAVEAEARRVYPAARRIIITPALDPSLIGGVRLELPGCRLDLSVAGELRKFKTLAVQGKDRP